MSDLYAFQKELKCYTCFYCDQEAYKDGDPCCTFPRSIAEHIEYGVCEKHKDLKATSCQK